MCSEIALFSFLARPPSRLSCYVAVSLKACIIVVSSSLYYTMDPFVDRFATAIIFPTRIDAAEGIIVACCTKASSIVQRRHSRLDDGSISNSPGWLLFQCYFYAGMSLLNWSAMTDPSRAVSSQPLCLLGQYLTHMCRKHGIDCYVAGHPLSYYNVIHGQPYFQGLRDLLRRLGVQVWLELTSRCSILQPGALDVSVRMFAGTYAEPQASQYLALRQSISSYSHTWVPQPWDWYRFPVWQSIGQVPADEYTAECEYDEDRIALRLAITESLDDL